MESEHLLILISKSFNKTNYWFSENYFVNVYIKRRLYRTLSMEDAQNNENMFVKHISICLPRLFIYLLQSPQHFTFLYSPW